MSITSKVFTLTEEQYKSAKREGDGICTLCRDWIFSSADPLAEGVYCPTCENRSLIGVQRARQLGLIEVNDDAGERTAL